MSRIIIRHGHEVFLDGKSIGFIRLDDGRWFAIAGGCTLGVYAERLRAIRALVYPPPVDLSRVGPATSFGLRPRKHSGRPVFEPGLGLAA